MAQVRKCFCDTIGPHPCHNDEDSVARDERDSCYSGDWRHMPVSATARSRLRGASRLFQKVSIHGAAEVVSLTLQVFAKICLADRHNPTGILSVPTDTARSPPGEFREPLDIESICSFEDSTYHIQSRLDERKGHCESQRPPPIAPTYGIETKVCRH